MGKNDIMSGGERGILPTSSGNYLRLSSTDPVFIPGLEPTCHPESNADLSPRMNTPFRYTQGQVLAILTDR